MKLLPLTPVQVAAWNRGATQFRVRIEIPDRWVVNKFFEDRGKAEIIVTSLDDESGEAWPCFLQPGDQFAVGEEWRVELISASYVKVHITVEYRDGKAKRWSLPCDTYPATLDAMEYWEKLGPDWQPASTMPIEFARYFGTCKATRAVRCQDASDEDLAALGCFEEDDFRAKDWLEIRYEHDHGIHSFDLNEWQWAFDVERELKGGAE